MVSIPHGVCKTYFTTGVCSEGVKCPRQHVSNHRYMHATHPRTILCARSVGMSRESATLMYIRSSGVTYRLTASRGRCARSSLARFGVANEGFDFGSERFLLSQAFSVLPDSPPPVLFSCVVLAVLTTGSRCFGPVTPLVTSRDARFYMWCTSSCEF